jgi:hypothetical protein
MMNYILLYIERYEVEVRDTQFGMEQITTVTNEINKC